MCNFCRHQGFPVNANFATVLENKANIERLKKEKLLNDEIEKLRKRIADLEAAQRA